MNKTVLFVMLLVSSLPAASEDGYRLWLRYDKIDNATLLQQYRSLIPSIQVNGSSQTINIAKEELTRGLEGLLGKKLSMPGTVTKALWWEHPQPLRSLNLFFLQVNSVQSEMRDLLSVTKTTFLLLEQILTWVFYMEYFIFCVCYKHVNIFKKFLSQPPRKSGSGC